jgi:hypothetical protein
MASSLTPKVFAHPEIGPAKTRRTAGSGIKSSAAKTFRLALERPVGRLEELLRERQIVLGSASQPSVVTESARWCQSMFLPSRA